MNQSSLKAYQMAKWCTVVYCLLRWVGKILQQEKMITAARIVSCVFTPASISTVLHTTIQKLCYLERALTNISVANKRDSGMKNCCVVQLSRTAGVTVKSSTWTQLEPRFFIGRSSNRFRLTLFYTEINGEWNLFCDCSVALTQSL